MGGTIMSQGTLLTFEEFAKYIGDTSHDLSNDSFFVMLVDNTLVPTVALSSPDSSDFTEVSGPGYSANGISLTTTWTEVGGVSSFKVTNSPISWVQNASGPTNVYYAIIYNFSHSGSTDAVGFIDMTADGGITPLSLQNADIVINFNANGIFKLSTSV